MLDRAVKTIAAAFSILSFMVPFQVEAEVAEPGRQLFFDEQFGLEFEIPPDWDVDENLDNQGQDIEDAIVLSNSDECAFGRCSISIGRRSNNALSGEPMSEWASRFIASITSDPDGFYQEPVRNTELPSGIAEGIRISGQEYQSINLRQGLEVWYISANFPRWSPQDETLSQVFESLRLYPSTEVGQRDTHFGGNLIFVDSQVDSRIQVGNELSTSWYSPVLNQNNGNPWHVHCGSSEHYGGSLYAADIDADYGVPVRAARGGEVVTVDKVGNASGFGKYVVIKTTVGSSDYYHYYAHLSSVRSYINVGYTVRRHGLLLGYVGNTGGVPTHLHFHVQRGASHTTASSLVLNGMVGFVDINYPGGGYFCATMGR